MKITHPVKGYSGPVVAGGRRIWFLGGEAEAANLKAGVRRELEDAGFKVESNRAAKDDAKASDSE